MSLPSTKEPRHCQRGPRLEPRRLLVDLAQEFLYGSKSRVKELRLVGTQIGRVEFDATNDAQVHASDLGLIVVDEPDLLERENVRAHDDFLVDLASDARVKKALAVCMNVGLVDVTAHADAPFRTQPFLSLPFAAQIREDKRLSRGVRMGKEDVRNELLEFGIALGVAAPHKAQLVGRKERVGFVDRVSGKPLKGAQRAKGLSWRDEDAFLVLIASRTFDALVILRCF